MLGICSGSMGCMTNRYTPTIGLEIHAELKTETKMFCGSRNAPHEAEPNTHVCPICMGHPGTLPVINREAVRSVLLVGRALNGDLATYTEFDRKHYFYPDIPKGYQISQYAYPLVKGGSLAGVEVTRVHLEEDTARSIHDRGEGSLIDYNRAGVPLMELVTEPVIHDAETAGTFARELQLLLRSLGVSDANMERGEMRVEVNISVSATDVPGTKVEVKNLNSFRSVESAIAYEIERQVGALERGEVLVQETRGWDEVREETVSQRKKESSHDYRYFPDPDLPKLNIAEIPEFSISRLDEMMSETPSNKRIKFANLGLPSNIAEVLVSNLEAGHFYSVALQELTLKQGKATDEDCRKLANYVTSDLLGYVTEHPEHSFADASAERFASLLSMLITDEITSRVAKDLLIEVVFAGGDPKVLVASRGLAQQGGADTLEPIVDTVIAEYAGVVDEYRAGKEAALQFLIGQCMKATKGAANPAELKKILIQKLS